MFSPADLPLNNIKIHSQISTLADIWSDFVTDDNPFISFDFLHALEKTGCVIPDTGWQPYHLSLHKDGTAPDADSSDNILGLMPLYLKIHSYGEYVFDHAWAHAWEQAGGHYYPKLLCAVPFTPVSGTRFFTKAQSDEAKSAADDALLAALVGLCQQQNFSSAHINFPCEEALPALRNAGLLIRQDVQFHWFNKNYQSFDDFLQDLSSRKRKNIRKERAEIKERQITFRTLSAGNIGRAEWDQFYQFYIDTYNRKWGVPYLNRDFFTEIAARMGDKIVLIMAYHQQSPVAAALNFIGGGRLYGRNWGCNSDFPFLHFETCYYQAIDYAIQHQLSCVEAGTQGGHKLTRGYQPVKTYSAHYLPHPGFRDAVAQFIAQTNEEQEAYFAALDKHLPFKHTSSIPEAD